MCTSRFNQIFLFPVSVMDGKRNSRDRVKLLSPSFLLLQITSSAILRSGLLLLLLLLLYSTETVASNAFEWKQFFFFLRFRFIYINIFYDYYSSVVLYCTSYIHNSVTTSESYGSSAHRSRFPRIIYYIGTYCTDVQCYYCFYFLLSKRFWHPES